MDPILTSLLNAGLPGSMAAAFIYFCWHVLTKTLPEQRAEFLAALREQRTESQSMSLAQTESHERTLTKLSDAVTALSVEVRAVAAQRLAEKGHA